MGSRTGTHTHHTGRAQTSHKRHEFCADPTDRAETRQLAGRRRSRGRDEQAAPGPQRLREYRDQPRAALMATARKNTHSPVEVTNWASQRRMNCGVPQIRLRSASPATERSLARRIAISNCWQFARRLFRWLCRLHNINANCNPHYLAPAPVIRGVCTTTDTHGNTLVPVTSFRDSKDTRGSGTQGETTIGPTGPGNLSWDHEPGPNSDP